MHSSTLAFALAAAVHSPAEAEIQRYMRAPARTPLFSLLLFFAFRGINLALQLRSRREETQREAAYARERGKRKAAAAIATLDSSSGCPVLVAESSHSHSQARARSRQRAPFSFCRRNAHTRKCRARESARAGSFLPPRAIQQLRPSASFILI